MDIELTSVSCFESDGDGWMTYKVGDCGVQKILWRKDGFCFVFYADRSFVINLNLFTYIECVERK